MNLRQMKRRQKVWAPEGGQKRLNFVTCLIIRIFAWMATFQVGISMLSHLSLVLRAIVPSYSAQAWWDRTASGCISI